MTVRIAQISDAHLSRARPFFATNFDKVAQAIRDASPDLILATGDLSIDGCDSDEEAAYAVAMHAGIGPEMLCIPGNHDVGNIPMLNRMVVNDVRLARWAKVAGPSTWVRDLPGWRLVGLDTQSLEANEQQWQELERAIADAGTRRVALVQHNPLTLDTMMDTALMYWPVLPKPRARLLGLFGDRKPDLVISGHVHQWRERMTESIKQVWAPSTAFILGDAYQPVYGSKLLGWVEHAFHADGTHEARLRTVDGLQLHDLGQMPEVFGRQQIRLADQPDRWDIKP
jgi:3',5'-cyclic AMP phosphodiesterase CpdA